MGKFYLACSFLLLIILQRGNAQAPVFSYKAPQKFIVNVSHDPVSPTVKAGSPVLKHIYSKASTVAGSGFYGNKNGPVSTARFESPIGITQGKDGAIYVADANLNMIKKIKDGIVSTLAGGGSKGIRNGKGSVAHFNYPTGVAVDDDNNVYVADFGNSLIRKITPDGTVSTFAGDRKASGTDDGVGINARFTLPYAITVNGPYLYVADTYNSKIRRIALTGANTGAVTTIAGSGAPGHKDNNDPLQATFNVPNGIAVDHKGNIYIADKGNQCIRKISASNGAVSTFSTGYYKNPVSVAVDNYGYVYVSCEKTYNILRLDPATGKPTTKLPFSGGTFKDVLNSTDTLTRYRGNMGLGFNNYDGEAYALLVAEPGSDLIRQVNVYGYSISPRLPKGIALDSTGTIKGTATAIQTEKTYTVSNTNYFGTGAAKLNISIAIGSQTITFNKLPVKVYGDTTGFDPGAVSTNSTIPIAYSSSDNAVATVIKRIHIKGAGTTVITASQEESKNYTAAKSVSQTLSVKKAPVTVVANDTTITEGLFENPKLSVAYFGFVNGQTAKILKTKAVAKTTATAKSAPGIYTITASGADADNYEFNYKPGRLTIFPVPTVSATGSTTIIQGGSVILSVSPVTGGYSYQWYLDGVAIKGANSTTYKATKGGGYNVSITKNAYITYSLYTGVTAQYVLPPDNFKIQLTSVTCKGSNNGAINITAAKKLNYSAVVSGNGLNTTYDFTDNLKIDNLSPGSYSVCITIKNEIFSQCFQANVTEPKDLAVYSTVDNTAKTVNLQLDGGTAYIITLNSVNYTTTKGEITLPLLAGSNKLKITTDRLCQGVVEKTIEVPGDIIPYPNPFHDIVNVSIGNVVVNQASVSVISISSGKTVYTNQYNNTSGVLQIDLSNLPSGLYYLNLDLDNKKSGYKIIKK